jgi:hypothetical protein
MINPIHTTPSYICKTHFILFSHLRLGLSTRLFPCGFPTKILYALFFFRMGIAWLAHLILLDLVILIIFVEILIFIYW